jgi:hypothetical protein
MTNLRALAEADLAHTLEGEFASVITLIGPDGATQTVAGRVRLSRPRTSIDTGAVVFDFDPSIEIRRSSLSPVPAVGERWLAIIPDGPRADAGKLTMLLDWTRTSEGSRTLGTIKFPLQTADQVAEASS